MSSRVGFRPSLNFARIVSATRPICCPPLVPRRKLTAAANDVNARARSLLPHYWNAAAMLVRPSAPPHTYSMTRARLESPFDPSPQPQMRMCEHPGCAAGGDFRAPRSRASLDLYYWFCLDHVREYNAAWNYYAGMSEAEIEAEIRHDTTWQRPTWPLGSRFSPNHAPGMRDDFGIFGDPSGETAHETPRNKRQLTPQEAALVVFEIAPPFTLVRLKARYKELVKLHHPDAHGGDKAAEEKLKVINQAYSTLKASYFS